MTTGGNGYKAVIYDCDGVMFDSFEANVAFYDQIMEEMGCSPIDRANDEHLRVLHTFANREVLSYFFTNPDHFHQAVRFAGTIDYRKLVPFLKMEEGLRETLHQLKKMEMYLAVCTNRSTSMEMLLESFDLTEYFSFVMTAGKVTNPKPHPEPLLKVLDHFKISPCEALFVGDSAVDCQAAEASNIPFVAYKADLLPSVMRIDRHAEILALL